MDYFDDMGIWTELKNIIIISGPKNLIKNLNNKANIEIKPKQRKAKQSQTVSKQINKKK